jgi:hypothetical protein
MGVSWGMLAPFFALVVTVAVMQVAVFVTGVIRRHDYLRFEDQSASSLARQFPLPKVPSIAEQHRNVFSPFLNKAHKAANDAQTTYYNAVVRSAGCLVLAFFALAISTLRPEDWPVWLDWPSVQLLLNWVDVIAVLFVLILFLYGRVVSQPWLAGRAGTELLRQYEFLSAVFPSAVWPAPIDDRKSKFDYEADMIAARVQDGPITDIIARIVRFWSTRKAAIESSALTEADLTADALLVYLQRRARRQLGWIADSKARLEHIAERRNFVLLSLYCITAGLAVLKHVLFMYGAHSQAFLLPPLLIVTGISAAMTAYYINQNSRSLIHRYNTQQRFITGWLVAFNDRWNFASLPTLTIDAAAKNEMRTQILWFENLMIEELIDWSHITSRDAIELAP